MLLDKMPKEIKLDRVILIFYTLVHRISLMYKVQTEESKSHFCKLNIDVTVQPAVSYCCWLTVPGVWRDTDTQLGPEIIYCFCKF